MFYIFKDYPNRIEALADRTYEILEENPDLPEKHDIGFAIKITWTKIFQSLM